MWKNLFGYRSFAASISEGFVILYVLSFLVAFVFVYLTIPPIRKLAFRLDFVDKPRPDSERKVHREPIPMLASLPIFAGFLLAYLTFVHDSPQQMTAILSGGLLILGIGLLDDWFKTHGREMPAWPKLIVQLFSAILIYHSGIIFYGFSNPLGSGDILLPTWLQFILTVLWIFGVTTVINFSDGLDGLAGGLTTISAMTLFVVALAKGQSDSAMMAIILVGVTLAYLRYNRHPANIFMGDAGATFLGFVLAVVALDGAFKQATVLSLFIPVLALGVPIFDNLFVVYKRWSSGKPIYQADATQAHYRLLSSGLTQKQVVAFLCLLNLCFGLTSIILTLLNV